MPVASADVGKHQLSGTETTELPAVIETFQAVASPEPADGDAIKTAPVDGAAARWGDDPDESGPQRPIRSRRVRLAVIVAAICAAVCAVVAAAGWTLRRTDAAVVDTAVVDAAPDLFQRPDGSIVVPATSGLSTPSSPRATPQPTPSRSHLPTATPDAIPSLGVTASVPTATVEAPGPNLLPLTVNTTRSLRSVSQPDRYLGQVGFLADLVQVTDNSSASTKQTATFTVVTGLADASCYSFLADGHYLRHRAFRLRLETDDSSNLFKNDATFCVGAGSAVDRSPSNPKTTPPITFTNATTNCGSTRQTTPPPSAPTVRSTPSRRGDELT